jgi:TM2 domain-containing membrane protein YozV
MAEYTPEDAAQNKTMGALAWYFFFIPWFTAKDSEFVWACARRGLLCNIITWVFSWTGILYVIGLILSFVGLLQGFGGKLWAIPLIDKFADDWFGGFMKPKA